MHAPHRCVHMLPLRIDEPPHQIDSVGNKSVHAHAHLDAHACWAHGEIDYFMKISFNINKN